MLQVSHHPPMSAGHAENDHFIYDVTSKLKTKFLGNSVDVYPVGRSVTQVLYLVLFYCAGPSPLSSYLSI